MTATIERTDKKFEVLELCWNETKGPSIHDENQRPPVEIRDGLPKELVTNDLSKFTGNEDPLVHVKAFKGQMALKGVGKDLWPLVFPHSLGPVVQSWFYALDAKQAQTWEDITIAFTDQFKDNAESRASMRTLEVLFQKENDRLPAVIADALFDYASASLDFSTSFAKPAGSFTARSASILRLISILDFFSPSMKRE